MPSPFPGVDPYLEAQESWEDFHAKFINYAQEMLADRLPDPYEARIEQRFSLVFVPEPRDRQQFQPDVAVLRRAAAAPAAAAAAGVLAVEPVTVPLWFPRIEEGREPRIEIRRRPGRSLIGVIELLSPSNKEAPGRRIYEAKRLEVLQQPVHLVEVDLLVRGSRPLMAGPMPPGDDFAYVSRAERRPDCDVFAWSIRQPLPPIPIPLLDPDPDVRLDLAAVFTTAYDRGRYARSIDDDAPLALPLAPEDRAWAEELARASRR